MMNVSMVCSCVAGYDLIVWLRNHLHIGEEDTDEALHLAQLLCQYGYFFPIQDPKNLVVKGDISLYRFQVGLTRFGCKRQGGSRILKFGGKGWNQTHMHSLGSTLEKTTTSLVACT